MQEFSSNMLMEGLESGQYKYSQLYNLDLELSQYHALRHYIENDTDIITKSQLLNIMFFDIEVYTFNTGEFLPDKAKQPISAITIYSTVEKVFHTYFLVLPQISRLVTAEYLHQFKIETKQTLLDNKYILEDEDLHIYLFTDELKMIEACWKMIHEIDPAILSGWNADTYDLPYIYTRLNNKYEDEKKVCKTLSKFGVVKKRKTDGRFILSIADYPLIDLLRLYKPRDDGGLAYGKKQASYSLDYVSDAELHLKKISYKDEGMSLDKLYETDPYKYILYNIADVALTVRLNQKLQHIELHNIIRRSMKASMSVSLRGQTGLFGSYYSFELERMEQKFKWGIVPELTNSLDKFDIQEIPRPTEKATKWDVIKVDISDYQKIVNRYPGAYVKDCPGKIVTASDGLLIDLDATALLVNSSFYQ